MPVIHTHVSVSTTPEQQRRGVGKAITAVPGKSGKAITVRGRAGDDQPAGLEVNVFPFLGKADNMRDLLHARHSRGPHLHPTPPPPPGAGMVNVFGRSVPGSAYGKPGGLSV